MEEDLKIITGASSLPLVALFLVFVAVQIRGRSDEEAYLPAFSQPRVMFAVGSIIGTSMVMMWVEVFLLRMVILPSAHSQVLTELRCGVDGLVSPVGGLEEQLGLELGLDLDKVPEFRAAMIALAKQDMSLVLQINNYAVLNMAWFFVFLAVLMLLIWKHLKWIGRTYKLKHVTSISHILAAIYGVLFGFVLFGLFQYAFYRLAINYTYPGANEILYETQTKVYGEMCGFSSK